MFPLSRSLIHRIVFQQPVNRQLFGLENTKHVNVLSVNHSNHLTLERGDLIAAALICGDPLQQAMRFFIDWTRRP